MPLLILLNENEEVQIHSDGEAIAAIQAPAKSGAPISIAVSWTRQSRAVYLNGDHIEKTNVAPDSA